MEEIVKETETVETEVVKDEFAEEIDAKTAERLRKFHEKEEAERIKEELKAQKLAEKEAKIKAKLERDMELHYARKAKHDAWRSARDEKRIARDILDKQKADAKREAKRVYYTQDQLVPLLANRNAIILEKGKKNID